MEEMKVIILALILFISSGCLVTGKEIAWGLGGIAYISKELLDRKHEKREAELTERGLDLKKREIELKEKQFEKVSELNERLDTVESFMKYFPKQFKDLGSINESEI